jgi:hypothetical protein
VRVEDQIGEGEHVEVVDDLIVTQVRNVDAAVDAALPYPRHCVFARAAVRELNGALAAVAEHGAVVRMQRLGDRLIAECAEARAGHAEWDLHHRVPRSNTW